MTTATTTRPVDHIRVGAVEATIWPNAGKDRTYYTVTLGRRYRDEGGNPQSTQSFRLIDLLPLSKVSDLADSRIRELEDEAYQQGRTAQAANAGASR